MQPNRSVIVGAGEVGNALLEVLFEYQPQLHDPTKGLIAFDADYIDYLHICFPYTDTFVEEVKNYQLQFHPKHTIIHSTVPVGTTRQVGATHSPIRGIHPHLQEGIKTFVKFLGGEEASEVADYFRKAGLKVMLFDKAETTEAMKLFDTEYYRVCIEFAHKVKKYCTEHDLNFHEVYTLGNLTYNDGYTMLDHPEFVRPVLQPIMLPIGGHCVMPNKKLLEKHE